MNRAILPLFLIFIASAAVAQTHGTGPHSHTSPYAGQEQRTIKSLSDEDIAELRRGGGWGLAKAAELNGVPGPAHLLELEKEIGLSAEQVSKLKAIFADMQQKAAAEGLKLIAGEQALEDAFRSGPVPDARLRELIAQIEASRAQLRYIHLSAHLTSPPLLTADQIDRYRKLRGYGANPCASVPVGHDARMWRLHNGCK